MSAIQLLFASAMSTAVHAAWLGEAKINSGLGQPLSARIRINAQADESINRNCFSVIVHDGDETGAIRLSAVDFAPDKSGGGWLEISTQSSLLEPITQLTVHMRCVAGVDLNRVYTLFLDPPVIAPHVVSDTTATSHAPSTSNGAATGVVTPSSGGTAAPHTAAGGNASSTVSPTVAVASSIAPTTLSAATSIAALATQRYPNEPDSRKLFIAHLRALNPTLPAEDDAPLPAGAHLVMPSGPLTVAHPLMAAKGDWKVAEGESFFAIVRKLYPDQPGRKRALVALMRQLNPDLPRDGEKPLPAGMQLKLPSRLDRLPTPDDQAGIKGRAVKHETPSAVPASGKPPPTTASNQPSTEGSPAGRLVVSGGAKPGKAQDAAIQQLQDREATLTDQITDQTAKLNEANYRIDKLEKRMNALAAELARKEQDIKAAEARREQQFNAARKREWTELIGVGIGSAALVALLAFLLHRISSKREKGTQLDLLPAAPLPDPSTSMLWQDIHAPEPKRDPPPGPPDRAQERPSASDMDVYFLSNIASEAALLAAHGQYGQAVQLLKDEIDRHPTQVVNWMQLLELLHGHRDIEDFVVQAGAFRERFASEALWERVARFGRELVPRHPLFSRGAGQASPVPPPPPEPNDAGDELARALDGLDEPSPAEQEVDLQLEFETPPVAETLPPISAHTEHHLDIPETGEPEYIALDDSPPPADWDTPSEALLVKSQDDVEEPLMFELNIDEIPSEAVELAVDAAQQAAMTTRREIDLSGVVEGSIEHANLLVQAGRREEGAAMLEHLMLIGSLEQRLAAAEMLVKLTSPL